jgi:hypothetical protein
VPKASPGMPLVTAAAQIVTKHIYYPAPFGGACITTIQLVGWPMSSRGGICHLILAVVINKYGNVRPATLKKLEKVLKEHQVLEEKGIVSNVKNYFHKALTIRPGVVDRLIKQHGDKRVIQVTILRKPVQGGVPKIIKFNYIRRI